MPVASVIAWCDRGTAADVASRAEQLNDVEVFDIRLEQDAVVLVLEADARDGIDTLWQRCRALAGVKWIDGAWYGDEGALS